MPRPRLSVFWRDRACPELSRRGGDFDFCGQATGSSYSVVPLSHFSSSITHASCRSVSVNFHLAPLESLKDSRNREFVRAPIREAVHNAMRRASPGPQPRALQTQFIRIPCLERGAALFLVAECLFGDAPDSHGQLCPGASRDQVQRRGCRKRGHSPISANLRSGF